MLRKFAIETHGYGSFFRWARNAAAAKQRVAFYLFGRSYCGYEIDYWTVREIATPIDTKQTN